MRRRKAILIAGPHVAATTVDTHDGVGRPVRKLWPWEVITDRYHFNLSLPQLAALSGACCLWAFFFLCSLGWVCVKMVVVTGDGDARGEPLPGAARRGGGCRGPGWRISLAGASPRPLR